METVVLVSHPRPPSPPPTAWIALHQQMVVLHLILVLLALLLDRSLRSRCVKRKGEGEGKAEEEKMKKEKKGRRRGGQEEEWRVGWVEGEGVRVREEKVKARKIKLKNHIITTFVLCYVPPHWHMHPHSPITPLPQHTHSWEALVWCMTP